MAAEQPHGAQGPAALRAAEEAARGGQTSRAALARSGAGEAAAAAAGAEEEGKELGERGPVALRRAGPPSTPRGMRSQRQAELGELACQAVPAVPPCQRI